VNSTSPFAGIGAHAKCTANVPSEDCLFVKSVACLNLTSVPNHAFFIAFTFRQTATQIPDFLCMFGFMAEGERIETTFCLQ
jgi:hypothetical protein